MDGTKHLGARIPVWVAAEIERIAKEHGLDRSDIIRDALKTDVEAVNAKRCPECGVENDEDAKYCKNCGKALKIPDGEELEKQMDEILANPDKLKELLLKLQQNQQ